MPLKSPVGIIDNVKKLTFCTMVSDSNNITMLKLLLQHDIILYYIHRFLRDRVIFIYSSKHGCLKEIDQMYRITVMC